MQKLLDRCSPFLVLWLLIFATPSTSFAATPVGYFDGINPDGTIFGWSVDLDAPAAAIEIHVYMDGPAGNGGRLVGTTKAAAPRPDLNAEGFSGDHGFVYPLPPVTRDGKPHTYYVYGIDTSRIGSENRLLVGSPQTATLPSTIVRIDNGTIRVGIEPRCGGTIAEITFQGTNLVNSYDCTGRQIQVAQYDGNEAYDSCAGCTGSWGWNPVQGGDLYGLGSVLLAKTVTRDSTYIKTRPYHWLPEAEGGEAGRPVLSDVIVEQWLSFVAGAPYAVKVRSKITHEGSDHHALANQEFPATYVNQGFDSLVYYGGDSPWTGAAVRNTTIQAGVLYNAAENWAAFVDRHGRGLTVYVPGQYPYITGFRMGDPIAGPYSNGFNYFTPFMPFEFRPGAVLEGDIYLIAGDYVAARQLIYNLKSNIGTPDFLPPFGHLDSPSHGQALSGTVAVAGWVFDNEAVNRIDVLINGVSAGNATYGQPRPDVASVYPNISPNTGYFFTLDTSKYANGEHTIAVRAVDSAGNESRLTKPVVVNIDNVAVSPTAKFALGGRVKVTVKRVNIYRSANGRNAIGSQSRNATATIVGGPEQAGGRTWWNLNFDKGVDGWGAETSLEKIPSTSVP